MTPRLHVSFIVLGLSIAAVYPAAWGADSLEAKAQTLLDESAALENMVGLSAAIAVNGETRWAGGAGFLDLENRVPAHAEMVHRIASISKPQTAVAIMQLVEQRKIRLDNTAQSYITNYPEKKWPMTVRQLLNHTAGVRHYHPGEAGTMENFGYLKKALRVFKDDPLLFEPGTGYNYTTYGYSVLGVIVENASGKRFGEYMHDHIWSPAGMEYSRLELRGEIVPNRARGYSVSDRGELVNARYTDLSIKYPGGGMVSTVEDLLRFNRAFWDGTLVSQESRDSMLKPTTLADGSVSTYGLGWGVTEDGGHGPAYAHSGGQAGTSTYLVHHYEAGIAVAVISNVDGTSVNVQRLAGKLADLAANK